jgi:hypothetical protein
MTLPLETLASVVSKKNMRERERYGHDGARSTEGKGCEVQVLAKVEAVAFLRAEVKDAMHMVLEHRLRVCSVRGTK